MELNGYRLLLPEGTLDYFDLVDVRRLQDLSGSYRHLTTKISCFQSNSLQKPLLS